MANPWKDHNHLWSYMKMAIKAKGPDFVIVSYVKRHAKEIHIAVGKATHKEAETNREADKRAAKGAKIHEIPQLIIENYKVQMSHTRLMQ